MSFGVYSHLGLDVDVAFSTIITSAFPIMDLESNLENLCIVLESVCR